VAIVQMPSLATLGANGKIDASTIAPVAVSAVSVGIADRIPAFPDRRRDHPQARNGSCIALMARR
jgi:hypothetical protein